MLTTQDRVERKVLIKMRVRETVVERGVIIMTFGRKEKERRIGMFLWKSVKIPKIIRVAERRICSHVFSTRWNGPIKFFNEMKEDDSQPDGNLTFGLYQLAGDRNRSNFFTFQPKTTRGFPSETMKTLIMKLEWVPVVCHD